MIHYLWPGMTYEREREAPHFIYTWLSYWKSCILVIRYLQISHLDKSELFYLDNTIIRNMWNYKIGAAHKGGKIECATIPFKWRNAQFFQWRDRFISLVKKCSKIANTRFVNIMLCEANFKCVCYKRCATAIKVLEFLWLRGDTNAINNCAICVF